LQDELFVKFCCLINKDIQNLNKDEATLGGIEERWGMWLKTLDLDKPSEEILNCFSGFRNLIL